MKKPRNIAGFSVSPEPPDVTSATQAGDSPTHPCYNQGAPLAHVPRSGIKPTGDWHGPFMKKCTFDCVLIDFYGTIAAGDRAAVESTCRTIVSNLGLSISPADFAIRWGERFFKVVGESSHDAFRTLFECEMTSLAMTFEEHGIAADPAPFVAELEAYWRNPPLHLDAIDFLKELQMPVCVVSNADSAPLQAAIQKHQLRFDVVVSSESVRSYKPDGHIFRNALQKMGVSATRAIHVGDSLHSDVAGAQRAGMTAAWVCREDRIYDIGRCEPCHTCFKLTEIHHLFW